MVGWAVGMTVGDEVGWKVGDFVGCTVGCVVVEGVIYTLDKSILWSVYDEHCVVPGQKLALYCNEVQSYCNWIPSFSDYSAPFWYGYRDICVGLLGQFFVSENMKKKRKEKWRSLSHVDLILTYFFSEIWSRYIF